MGSPFGRSGYRVDKGQMRDAQSSMSDAANQGYSPGSSGYNVQTPAQANAMFGVNPQTGRSFTQQSSLNDFVPGGYENAFTNMANKQMDALKRGQAGGLRAAASSMGRGGLGRGNMAGPTASIGRGMADIQRQTGMDKLNYGTDAYKFDRQQSLADELGLGQLGLGRHAAALAGTQAQFGMDRSMNMDNFMKAMQNYQALSPFADKGSQGWLAPALQGGLSVGMAAATGGASAVPSMMGGMGGSNGFNEMVSKGTWLDPNNSKFNFKPSFTLNDFNSY